MRTNLPLAMLARARTHAHCLTVIFAHPVKDRLLMRGITLRKSLDDAQPICFARILVHLRNSFERLNLHCKTDDVGH